MKKPQPLRLVGFVFGVGCASIVGKAAAVPEDVSPTAKPDPASKRAAAMRRQFVKLALSAERMLVRDPDSGAIVVDVTDAKQRRRLAGGIHIESVIDDDLVLACADLTPIEFFKNGRRIGILERLGDRVLRFGPWERDIIATAQTTHFLDTWLEDNDVNLISLRRRYRLAISDETARRDRKLTERKAEKKLRLLVVDALKIWKHNPFPRHSKIAAKLSLELIGLYLERCQSEMWNCVRYRPYAHFFGARLLSEQGSCAEAAKRFNVALAQLRAANERNIEENELLAKESIRMCEEARSKRFSEAGKSDCGLR